ncbi:MAG: 3-hydroxyacyl-CoA dehydrogenase NAD-binding domain-containing protein [Gammaproteobacteria bacterium]
MTSKNEQHWRIERDEDGIAWLHLDKAGAGTNVLSIDVITELDEKIQSIESEPPRGLVILSDKENGFIAGADIKSFTSMATEEEAAEFMRGCHTVLDRIEAFSFPTVSLIHGFCLGGGLELALACRYRIADEDSSTRLGLPEVRLGIHPGFGGTLRSTRLIGAPAAMDMMLTGRGLSARAAQKVGLIDYAVPKRQLLRAAREVVMRPPKPHRPGRLQALASHRLVRPLLAKYLKKVVAKKASKEHYPAPYALIDLWVKHADDAKTMLAEEARSVARLVVGDTAQNLIRVFFLQEQLKGLGRHADFKARHVHVVGAGVMGGDIAAWCALQGLHVTLQDQAPERIAPAMKRAYALYKKKLKKPRLIQAVMDRLMPDINGLGVERADVIIEAIFENIEAKQNLFKDVEARMKPDAVMASNTSSIPLDEIGAVLKKPERLVGIHFFNPVAKMQLVEIVYSDKTDKDVSQKAASFTRQISRLPLPVTSTPGFLVNRILMPYLLEAVTMESEGIQAELIDKQALAFGMPMGPIELADTVGLDICLHVADILSQSMGTSVPERLRQLVNAGSLGRKSGKGFYEYKKGKPVKARLENVQLSTSEVADRMIFAMLNEAMACLREGVVENGDLLDAGIIFGTGFAPFRGGPVQYIQQSGVSRMAERLEQLASKFGDRFSADDGFSNL